MLGRCAARTLVAIGAMAALVFARAQSPEQAGDTRDTLVYRDGDRVRGELVENTATLIIFRSTRFGELRVPADRAVVIKGEPGQSAAAAPSPTAAVAPAPRRQAAAERADEEKVSAWNRFYPAVLTARVRNFFGPWHGRFMFSNELVTDTAHRSNVALEGKLTRKFTRDTVALSARYDYDQVDGFATMNDLKGIASWRHDFTRRQFAQYRPTIEWDRSARRGRYILVNQELGYGVSVLSGPARHLRLGVSENVLDVWGSPLGPRAGHGSRAVPSLFDEAEVALPWRISVTQRGVWYPQSTPYGWEDRTELNKKLTETLSVGLTHEIRRRNPDARDYERLRLLLGLDF